MGYLKSTILWIYNNAINLRNKVSYIIYKHQKTFDIMTPNETVAEIINNRELSISRFGDGEYSLMEGQGTGFQSKDEELGKRLREVLLSDNPNCLVCIPRPFVNTEQLAPKSSRFWKRYLGLKRRDVLTLTPKNKMFGDACFSRFYFENKDYDIESYIKLIKRIWDKKQVFIIEGVYTRFGVGNDLLDNAKEVKRIICPAQNAYQKYSEIYNTALNVIPGGSLILIALGMTATVLAFDLSKSDKHYQAIDIGHLDIEYECYIRKSNGIIAIPGKAVNEAGQNCPQDKILDSDYTSSIIKTIV